MSGTRVLGIETSCDETAAAVVVDGHNVLSSVVSSQIDLHARYGGVVPEIASRAHVELLTPVIARSLIEAGIQDDHVDAVAATVGRLIGVPISSAIIERIRTSLLESESAMALSNVLTLPCQSWNEPLFSITAATGSTTSATAVTAL